MQATIDIGTVLTCMVARCTHNRELVCHAPDITVGAEHAMCDTYTTGTAPNAGPQAPVGTCRIADCSFNEGGVACRAAGITVGDHEAHADCVTYRKG